MPAEVARRAVRIYTWAALAAALVGLAFTIFPNALPAGGPWVQVALGIVAIVLAVRARTRGRSDVEDYDGRLSLLAALIGIGVTFWAGQFAVLALTTGA